jgi:chemotaxis response regulator CheB
MQRRRTVLLVEDETSITEPLAEALGREGFETQVAGTAAESLELAGRLEPDLVLLDVMLPDGSGFDVCRELRQRSRVPIIMLGYAAYVVSRDTVGSPVTKVKLSRNELAPVRERPRTAARPTTARTTQTTTGDDRGGDDGSGRGRGRGRGGNSGKGGGGGDDD